MKFALRNRRHPGGRSLKRPGSADVLLPQGLRSVHGLEGRVVEIAGGFGLTSRGQVRSDQIRRTNCLAEADRAMASIRRTVSSASWAGQQSGVPRNRAFTKLPSIDSLVEGK